jgi:hypothetical protein
MFAFFAACTTFFPPPVEAACKDPRVFYPDEDGDGVGEPTEVFVGCEAPDGWVEAVVPAATGDTGP